VGRPNEPLEFHDNYEKLSELIINNIKTVINKYTKVPYFAISIVGKKKKEVIMTLGGIAALYKTSGTYLHNITVFASNINNITYDDLKKLIERDHSELNIKCINIQDDDNSPCLCIMPDRLTAEMFSDNMNPYYIQLTRSVYRDDILYPISFNFVIPNNGKYCMTFEVFFTKIVNILPPDIFESIKYKIAAFYARSLNSAEYQYDAAKRQYETMKAQYESLLKDMDELLDEDQRLFIEVNRHNLS